MKRAEMNPNSTSERVVSLRARRRRETRVAILEAAEAELSDAGVAGTRMEAIAGRAGVAVGTIYNHFEDRDDLVAALVQSRREALLARLDAAVAQGRGRPLAEALGRLVEALYRHWQEHVHLLSRLQEAGELGRTGRGRPTDVAREVARRIEALLGRARGAEVRRGLDAATAAAALTGMARGVALEAMRQGAPPTAAAARTVVELFLRGAGGRP